jgi:cytochrome c oxidase subunit 2
LFYGECNQICGTNHDSMPINVVGLPLDQYNAWVKKTQAAVSAMASPVPGSSAPAVRLADAVTTTSTTR